MLKKAEAEIVFLRLVELGYKPIQGAFDFEHLKSIHIRDGNGRAIRAFLTQLSEDAGYRLTFENETREELLTADIAAFKGTLEPLSQLFCMLIEPI